MQRVHSGSTIRRSSDATAGGVGEIKKFLSTLLVLLENGNVESSDKNILLQKFREWEKLFPGTLASEVSERCLALLTDCPSVSQSSDKTPTDGRKRGMRPMSRSVKASLEGCLNTLLWAELPAYKARQWLKFIAMCWSAVYCGTDHQKMAWPQHKLISFTPSF